MAVRTAPWMKVRTSEPGPGRYVEISSQDVRRPHQLLVNAIVGVAKVNLVIKTFKLNQTPEIGLVERAGSDGLSDWEVTKLGYDEHAPVRGKSSTKIDENDEIRTYICR